MYLISLDGAMSRVLVLNSSTSQGGGAVKAQLGLVPDTYHNKRTIRLAKYSRPLPPNTDALGTDEETAV